jgi:hypothetical protein
MFGAVCALNVHISMVAIKHTSSRPLSLVRFLFAYPSGQSANA